MMLKKSLFWSWLLISLLFLSGCQPSIIGRVIGPSDFLGSSLTVNDTPPYPVVLLSPGNRSLIFSNFSFVWNNTRDPNGFNVTCQIIVSENTTLASPIINITNITQNENETTTLNVSYDYSLEFHYWSVRGFDGTLWGSFNNIYRFRWCVPNTNPQLLEISNQDATQWQTFRYNVSASDADNETLTFAINSPFTINGSGVIKVTPTESGDFIATIIVWDNCNAINITSFTLSVAHAARPQVEEEEPSPGGGGGGGGGGGVVVKEKKLYISSPGLVELEGAYVVADIVLRNIGDILLKNLTMELVPSYDIILEYDDHIEKIQPNKEIVKTVRISDSSVENNLVKIVIYDEEGSWNASFVVHTPGVEEAVVEMPGRVAVDECIQPRKKTFYVPMNTDAKIDLLLENLCEKAVTNLNLKIKPIGFTAVIPSITATHTISVPVSVSNESFYLYLDLEYSGREYQKLIAIIPYELKELEAELEDIERDIWRMKMLLNFIIIPKRKEIRDELEALERDVKISKSMFEEQRMEDFMNKHSKTRENSKEIQDVIRVWAQVNALILLLIIISSFGAYLIKKEGLILGGKAAPVFIKKKIISLGRNRYKMVFEIENNTSKEIRGFNLKYQIPKKVEIIDSSKKPLKKLFGKKRIMVDSSQIDWLIPRLRSREKLTIEYNVRLVGNRFVQE